VKSLLAVLLFSAAAFRAGTGSAEVGDDWKTAFQTAAEQHKDVLVDYAATWCKPPAI